MAEYIEKWSVVNRLIDLENEFQRYKPFNGFEEEMYRKVCEAEIAIGKTPTADVEPVKHGRWIRHLGNVECSECLNRYSYIGEANYCPNCGAKMDGDNT